MLSARLRRAGQLLVLAAGLGLAASPAFAAAGVASLGITGLTTALGLLAAFWALIGARGLLAGGSGAVTLLLTVAMLGSAFWVWRRQQLRARMVRPLLPRAAVVAIPPGLDGDAVLDAARGRFMSLQAAWDAADVPVLQSLTTPDMLEELLHVLSAREGMTASRTDVISLHAELLSLEELSAAYLASIEFTGLIRESAEQGPVPFRELWMLACSKGETAPSWRLARQQALL